ncbi:MAG TPA: hypothetical protein PKA29_00185 [Candidatus Saccharibacteria bacterium]|nr:hypothetical protein [Candidatus Saccharibacteria bacterium]
MNDIDENATVKQLKDELDKLLAEVQDANPEEIEESSLKLKRASGIIVLIENKLKFSEVEIREIGNDA